MNLSLAIFYLLYRLVLRKLTFFNFNRIYLLSAILVSAMIPFLKYSATARSGILTIQQKTGLDPAALLPLPAAQSGISIIDIATALYWAGVIVMGAIFLMQLASLVVFYVNSKKELVSGRQIRTGPGPLSPFSFFNSIFVNPHEHSATALQSILDHESVHAKQWHSIDILAGELKRIFCWFNPAAWLMLRAIRENLEFIADRKVLQNGTDARQYQYALLATQQNNRTHLLSNNFNLSHLKFRITMMNRSKSPDMQVLKYLWAIPAVAGLLLMTDLTQAKENPQSRYVLQDHDRQEHKADIADFTQAAINVYSNTSDKHIVQADVPQPPASPAPPALPVPPVPPSPAQPAEHTNSPDADKDRITSTVITEEIVDGKVTKSSVKIEARNIKFLSIAPDQENKENTKVHSNAVSTSFRNGDYKIYIDGARYYGSLTEQDPHTIKSISILSGQHAVDFDPALSLEDKIIVIESNKKPKTTRALSSKPFQVFPNPASSQWTITTEQSGPDDRYELFDRNGAQKASGKLSQKTQINAEALPEGIYFLKLQIGHKNYTTQLEKGR
ncbi:MAG: hypothetical protein BGO31_17310 [Bacteroidetes bacterium 43-16]|nr:MAG: hypothetical protein BGO31_17310 [Bacteroidetes bacterium 43-16]